MKEFPLTNDRARQSFRHFSSLFTFALLGALLLAGCGSSTFTGSNTTPTVSVSASPASITAGGSSTLTVAASNATTVTVTGTDGSSYNLTSAGGTQAVSPKATTTYTATAAGTGGNATATAVVTVTATTGPPPTVTLSANPTGVTAGGTSTLTATATNSSKVVITGSDGSSYSLAATGGTQAVTPAATTTYTATATGTNGTNVTATATVTVSATPPATVTITANPTTIVTGNSSTLTVTATNDSGVTITGTDGSSYALPAAGGTKAVTPAATTTYTATATGAGGNATATATVTVSPAGSVAQIDHVIFIMQENHTFDNYLGMLNPYRKDPLGTGTCPNNAAGVPQCYNVGDDGNTYNVDGIDDKLTTISDTSDLNPPNGETPSVKFNLFKLTSTCIDDDSSAWLSSFGDVNRYDNAVDRPIQMNGFVHTAQGYANSCNASGNCVGDVGDVFTDTLGARAMGYYDQQYFNYYYYMASQFALSDRWFSPIASKTVDNRIATFTGGTTQGLVQDPTSDDHLNTQLNIATIFRELNTANVSWKIYYTVTDGGCKANGDGDECTGGAPAQYPDTSFESFTDSFKYLQENPNNVACSTLDPNLQASSVVGDTSNSFCIDPAHIAPITQFYTDMTNNALPSFVWIDPGYGLNDEHPGSGQPVTQGQYEMKNILNAFMASPVYADSVFFLAYDEGGGPYDHVPPVPGHSNDFTNVANMGYLGDYPNGTIPDIGTIAVNPDTDPAYWPCLPADLSPWTASLHCDLQEGWAGSVAGDVVSEQGFAAQIGFRVPNMIISPFVRRHYVSHTPMDHTAILKFVESRFIGPTAHLTARDAAQPDLLEFFDFTNIPWATPPTPPTPFTDPNKTLCTPSMAPMNGVAPS